VAHKQGKQIEKVMDESMPIWLGILAVLGIIVLMRLFKQESDQSFVQEQKSFSENQEN
jgi:hypothetical protein